jgi:hypothetical protein
MPLGDWATWAQDLFVLVAAFFAGAAFWKQSKALKLQQDEAVVIREERRRQFLQERRAQASYVYMDYDIDDWPIELWTTVFVKVINESTLPVYDINIHWNIRPTPAGMVNHAGESVANLMPYAAQRITPKDEVSALLKWGKKDTDNFEIDPWVTFRDNSGVVWKITKSGILTEWGSISAEGSQ